MPHFAAQHSLFRAYDIRGTHTFFSDDFITALGLAFSKLYSATLNAPAINADTVTVVIGFDARAGSDLIAKKLACILADGRITVVTLGLITTPMMAFWAEQYDGHGIMVTASHSAKDNLGVKWLVANASPSAADIQQLYQQLPTFATIKSVTAKCAHQSQHQNAIIAINKDIVTDAYSDAIAAVFAQLYPHQSAAKIKLRLVIDCMHGATSTIAHALFSRFFTHVILLNDTPDGNFPTGNPDPTEPNRLAELQQTVIVTRADAGLAFDGDGDRLMVVDNSGKVIAPDHLLYLLAQVVLTERVPAVTDDAIKTDKNFNNRSDAPHVLFDIKCSHHLPLLLSKLGATPVMTQTGSSLLRQRLQSDAKQALFAGELSGHFIFNDGHHIVYDDAMYAGLRLLHWLRRSKASMRSAATKQITTDVWGEPKDMGLPCSITDITQSLPALVSTADHYLPLPDNSACGCSVVKRLTDFCHYLQTLLAHSGACPSDGLLSPCHCPQSQTNITLDQARKLMPAGTRLTCIDGVRLDFAHGFGVLRQSNTSHSLTVRFAGDSVADLQDVQSRFAALCQPFSRELATQIKAITAE